METATRTGIALLFRPGHESDRRGRGAKAAQCY